MMRGKRISLYSFFFKTFLNLFFSSTLWHVVSWFPNQGSNLHPLHTRAGSYALDYQCLCMHACVDSLWPHELQPTWLLCPRSFPDKNTGAGCHFLLQGIFQIEGLNRCLRCLLPWQVGSLPLCHLGSLPGLPGRSPNSFHLYIFDC